jgi:hypothetical protein
MPSLQTLHGKRFVVIRGCIQDHGHHTVNMTINGKTGRGEPELPGHGRTNRANIQLLTLDARCGDCFLGNDIGMGLGIERKAQVCDSAQEPSLRQPAFPEKVQELVASPGEQGPIVSLPDIPM